MSIFSVPRVFSCLPLNLKDKVVISCAVWTKCLLSTTIDLGLFQISSQFNVHCAEMSYFTFTGLPGRGGKSIISMRGIKRILWSYTSVVPCIKWMWQRSKCLTLNCKISNVLASYSGNKPHVREEKIFLETPHLWYLWLKRVKHKESQLQHWSCIDIYVVLWRLKPSYLNYRLLITEGAFCESWETEQ